MSPLKLSLLTALASAALTAGGFHYLHKQKVRAVESLRVQNNRLLFQAHQSRPAASAPATPAAHSEPPAAPAKMPNATSQPTENYRNEGQSTPLAALQTFAWACDRGDIESVDRMLHFEPIARIKAESVFKNQAMEARSTSASLENMTATQLTLYVMTKPFPSADVLDVARFENEGDNRTVFRGVHHDRTQLKKVGGSWKIVLTEELFDRLQRFTTEAQAAARP